MTIEHGSSTIPLSKTTRFIVDNRGRTAPTALAGIALIATNCISNDQLYPSYENIRYVSDETYRNWFRSHPQPGDIILTLKGSQNGAVCLVPDPVDFAIAQDMVALRADASIIDPLFLFAALRSPLVQWQIKNLDVSGVIPHLKKTDFDKLLLPYPDRSTQERIGATYFNLCSKIEQNRRTGRALERLARATFKAWFVDFEPVKAKAAGQTSFPGLPPAAFSALPDRLTDSPLGPVPQGWDTPPFDELVFESKERVGDADVPAYSSTNEGVFPRDERFKKELSRSQSKNLLVRQGDLVFGLSREILNFGVMYDEVGSVSPVYKVFRPKGALLSPHFIETMIRQRVGYYRQVVKSSSREGQSVMTDQFLRLAMLVPSAPIRQAFNRLEDSTRQLIEHLDNESSKLAALRDYLLPRLLSGRVRVREAEARVEDIA